MAPGATVAQVAEAALRQHLAGAELAAAALRRRPGGRALHDLRVSVRRFRAALRVFAPGTLRGRRAAFLRPLARLRGLLSSARDQDVWLAQVERWRGKAGRDSAADLGYARRLRSPLRRSLAALRQVAASGRLSSVLAAARRALPRVLQHLPEPEEDGAAYGAQVVRRGTRRLMELGTDARRPAEWHALRRRVRRTRYVAEFFAPLLGPSGGDLEQALRRVSGALGAVHDMDVAAERMGRSATAPGWLRRRVRQVRARAVRRFRKDWVRLSHLAESREFGRALKAARRGGHTELYVVRHGPAARAGEKGDGARALTRSGEKRVKRTGRALLVLGWTPQCVLTSPLLRCRQTARLLASSVSPSPAVVVCPELAPGVPAVRAVAALCRQKARSLAIVGHMPGLAATVSVLTGGGRYTAIALGKGGVCRVVFDSAPAPGAGTLSWLIQPRHLRVLARKG